MIYKIISLTLFLLLLIVGVYTNKGIPKSISDIFYNIGYRFTILLCIISGIIMPYIIYITPDTYKFTGFLCCASLMFVAFAPHYKEEFEGKVHFISAIISAIFAFIWGLCTNPLCLLCMLIGVFGILFNRQNWLWWCEISMFTLIYLILFL